MLILLLSFFLGSVQVAYSQDQSVTKPDSSSVTTPSSSDDGEYEIDYEEEPEAADAEVEPATPVQKSKKNKSGNTNGPAVQGSRAKNRFVPILKSETKSVYKKEGKVLDVDTD